MLQYIPRVHGEVKPRQNVLPRPSVRKAEIDLTRYNLEMGIIG
jgi:hypothetical protein